MKVDIAVDPLDGTSLVAGGRNGAVAVRPSHTTSVLQPRRDCSI